VFIEATRVIYRQEFFFLDLDKVADGDTTKEEFQRTSLTGSTTTPTEVEPHPKNPITPKKPTLKEPAMDDPSVASVSSDLPHDAPSMFALPPLAEGWVGIIDSSGMPYYFHEEMDEATCDRPTKEDADDKEGDSSAPNKV